MSRLQEESKLIDRPRPYLFLLLEKEIGSCAALCAGHYVSFIKSSEHRLLLDDKLVEVVNELYQTRNLQDGKGTCPANQAAD